MTGERRYAAVKWGNVTEGRLAGREERGHRERVG